MKPIDVLAWSPLRQRYMANQIIRDGRIINNEWQLLTDASIQEVPTGKIILSLPLWNQHAQNLANRKELPGLWINSHEHPAEFAGDIQALPLIAVHFPTFTDGRGFSLGSLLRERYAYRGELRAHGHFIRDQLFYLKRCGFDAFEFESDQHLPDAIKSFKDFSNSYQAAADQAFPLFRRR